MSGFQKNMQMNQERRVGLKLHFEEQDYLYYSRHGVVLAAHWVGKGYAITISEPHYHHK